MSSSEKLSAIVVRGYDLSSIDQTEQTVYNVRRDGSKKIENSTPTMKWECEVVG